MFEVIIANDVYFYIYVFISLVVIAALIVFIATFGLSFFTGAPFAVTQPKRIKRIIEAINKYKKGIICADLGSGDGRIVIELCKNGYQSYGYEINPFLYILSKFKIRKAGLSKKAVICRKNYWKENLSKYDAIVLFGVFYIMEKMEKKLLSELKPGAIVVCNYFKFPKWKPFRQEKGLIIYKK